MTRSSQWALVVTLLLGIVFDGWIRMNLDSEFIKAAKMSTLESRRLADELEEIRNTMYAKQRKPL